MNKPFKDTQEAEIAAEEGGATANNLEVANVVCSVLSISSFKIDPVRFSSAIGRISGVISRTRFMGRAVASNRCDAKLERRTGAADALARSKSSSSSGEEEGNDGNLGSMVARAVATHVASIGKSSSLSPAGAEVGSPRGIAEK